LAWLLRKDDATQSGQQNPTGNVDSTVKKGHISSVHHHQDETCRPPSTIKNRAAQTPVCQISSVENTTA
jgi:hypothetical protein